jgi:hypothetical protein
MHQGLLVPVVRGRELAGIGARTPNFNQSCGLFPGFSQPALLRVPERVLTLTSMNNNMYQGIGADDRPTAPIRVAPVAPGGPGGTGSAPGPGGPRAAWSRGKRAAAVAAVCAVVGGGTFAAVEAASGSPALGSAAVTQAAGTQAGTPASLTAQASVLRDVITTPGIRRLARLRHLGGMYGQYTFQTKKGPRTLAFERGTITSVGGGDVQVRAADGTTWTWVLTGTSVVRESGAKEAQTALAAGQAVFAGGQVASGTRDARLIVIRKAGASPQPSGTS